MIGTEFPSGVSITHQSLIKVQWGGPDLDVQPMSIDVKELTTYLRRIMLVIQALKKMSQFAIWRKG